MKIIAIKLPKFKIISKFKSFKTPLFKILLKMTKCPLEEIGIGSVKPWIIAKNKCLIKSIILSP